MSSLVEDFGVSEKVADLIEDIAYGIDSIQTLTTGEQLKTKNKKLQKYLHRTPLNEIIEETVIPVLEEIKNEYSWSGEWQFISGEEVVKLHAYPPYTDWCEISRSGNKPIKVNKKYFKAIYEERIIAIK